MWHAAQQPRKEAPPKETPEKFDSIHGLEVFTYRYDELLGLGFSADDAEVLADTREDIARIRTMVRSGCSPETAARILR